jgi:hypothetical protein
MNWLCFVIFAVLDWSNKEVYERKTGDCRDAGDPVPTEVGKEFVEVEAA